MYSTRYAALILSRSRVTVPLDSRPHRNSIVNQTLPTTAPARPAGKIEFGTCALGRAGAVVGNVCSRSSPSGRESSARARDLRTNQRRDISTGYTFGSFLRIPSACPTGRPARNTTSVLQGTTRAATPVSVLGPVTSRAVTRRLLEGLQRRRVGGDRGRQRPRSGVHDLCDP